MACNTGSLAILMATYLHMILLLRRQKKRWKFTTDSFSLIHRSTAQIKISEDKIALIFFHMKKNIFM